ncbi:T9SS type A sorting domain-containing protein [Paracrocinitomix mangrovi]|uniref:T9SS type A sorting domain-containing protein n=1 Tax=Paracrocinitomix mangrovi TaxID=2862509 RepID=UPI001C8E8DB6|nr:T9SS type A sorting domain-containing protein [Paracrocinitomix mangrovi]UKN01166.1 T9SS type A sorting domain-containing protein [Paracrocinitomix mangrovi]
MKIKFSLLSFLFVSIQSFAQYQWSEIGAFDGPVNALEVHENKIFAGGYFDVVNGNTSNFSAIYENNAFTYNGNSLTGIGIQGFAVYNDTLWSANVMYFGSSYGIAKWDGNTWIDGGNNYSIGFFGAYANDTVLYLGGFNGKIIKKTGTAQWVELPPTAATNDEIKDLTIFNDQLVMAGDFVSSAGTTLNYVGTYNGNSWDAFGSGLDSIAWCTTVYNNELYVGGEFLNAGGNGAKFIAKWNGTTWSDVGGSVTGSGSAGIRDMLVYNNKLYVAGDFDEIGGVAANGIAYWDGSIWSSMDFPANYSYPHCIEILDNYLYAGTYEGWTLQDTSHLLKAPISLASIDEADISLNVFPNPTYNSIQIQSGSNLEWIKIIDQQGKILIDEKVNQQEVLKYDISYLAKGIYFIQCQTQKGLKTVKIVKK